ncbi:MAG: cyclic pyranopterin monophosphate synthase MoaC [Alphaproteobacteria bacterium]|nr:cyclic pyranopterin monophosphate synthase MoaC [Alphaproteobacteria bacterium]
MAKLSHIDAGGKAKMVDVTAKDESEREAVAAARVFLNAETFATVARGEMAKGDVLTVARIAGIMAAKRTAELVPLCHPLPLTSVGVELSLDEATRTVEITATARTKGRTGVEMEAMTAASVAALTVYDMCKSADKAIRISDIRLLRKTGGKSGSYEASEPETRDP